MFANFRGKEKIPKAVPDKRSLTYKDRNIRLAANVSTESWQARKDCNNIFNTLNEKNMHPRLLYPTRLSFRIEGENRVSRTNRN